MDLPTDWSDVKACAIEAAGNWLKFESFGWGRVSELEHPEDWAIVYTHNRDSGLLDQSNASAIADAMAPHLEADDPDVLEESHNHWAVGWVNGYAIRTLRDGEPTPAWRAWCELQERLANYQVLDEYDYSRREHESALEWIEQEGKCWIADDAPDDWCCRVFSWLWENEECECENTDDTGAAPSEDSIRRALDALGWLDDS